MFGPKEHNFLGCVAIGCLLGAATVVTMAPTSSARAAVVDTCATGSQQNIEGYDAGQPQPDGGSYGNRAQIYINRASVINSLNGPIFRAVFVLNNSESSNDDLEVGWTANNGGYSNPVVYAE